MTARRRWRIAGLVVSAVAIAVAGCSSDGGSPADAAAGGRGRSEQAIPVAAIEASPRDLDRIVTVTGPVEPIRAVSVNAQTAGTLVSVLVEEGSRVRAGQLLAELDARESSAQLARAEAALVNAEAAFRRGERLQADALIPESELDLLRSAYAIAQADVELWRTRVAFSRIKAPVAGVVTAKRVEQGGSVAVNTTLFEIAEDTLLVVKVQVSELDVVHLAPGRAVNLRLDAYPDARLTGRIRRIFPGADPASRLVPVEVVLDPAPPGVEPRPGFLARVEFSLDSRRGVLAVPVSAVGVADGDAFVYVVEADTLSRRAVETGVTAAGWIEITRGLAAGARVVHSGHVNLRPGARVRVSGGDPADGPAR
ncbi:MAG TPA: efflux RND transporter periplasmic adaptor subunit [Candidatus Krumholzibacteria bacterium]|nr:efflux RND transporter periplasmic adaptor subunit [Candidatus Krumholzibacteria bacterium]HPD72911.1 efflux RND transporter periplasmic adaptor subunit [Candidatus Krumholzibacteria bacterium]HRY41710.1 efflux RND transporter periplasmic adaptor subunit [Candidatus Krumholzibacteria bacterium]